MNCAVNALVEHCGGRLTTGAFGNHSRGGNTSSDYVACLDAMLATNPDIVLLGDETNGIHRLPLPVILRNYEVILAKCQAHPGIQRIFIELCPRTRHLLARFEPSRQAPPCQQR